MERLFNTIGAACAAIVALAGVVKMIITGARRWDRLLTRMEALERGATSVDVRLGRIENVLTRQQRGNDYDRTDAA